MAIAPWLLPVLWREHDWRAALERVAQGAPRSSKKVVELGQASEYVEPDRRRAVAAYELAGERGRARELAIEIGWWSARARIAAIARAAPVPAGGDAAVLALDEAEAWWDAGQPDLCALAIGGLRNAERGRRGQQLAALVAERDLAERAAEVLAEAEGMDGTPAADAYVMAARFARALGQPDNVTRWLEAAVEADRRHAVAARFLLELARREPDAAGIKHVLRVRLEGVDLTTWVDGMRAAAIALVDSEHHRGFGLRVLRQVLERAYESRLAHIPGHIAMWTVLAAHASASGTRRELLPFVIEALELAQHPVDRVWLGALATEITLRDAGAPVVAGAYAEIVTEHAPNHPIVRELVAAVAEHREQVQATVPAEAIHAAIDAAEIPVEIDLGLDDAYADAAEVTDSELEDGEAVIWDKPIPASGPVKAPISEPASARPRAAANSPFATQQVPIALRKPAGPAAADADAVPAPVAAPDAEAVSGPVAASDADAVPAPVQRIATKPLPGPSRLPSIAPASLAKPVAPAKQSAIIPASITNPSSMIPAAKPAPRPRDPNKISTGNLPAISRAIPVLTALRTPDRPAVPPKPADPPNAKLRARRITVPIDVRLVLADTTRADGHSRDISTTGLYVLTSAALAVGDELEIELLLPGKEAFTEEQFRARARVARRGEDGFGLELVKPDGALVRALDSLG